MQEIETSTKTNQTNEKSNTSKQISISQTVLILNQILYYATGTDADPTFALRPLSFCSVFVVAVLILIKPYHQPSNVINIRLDNHCQT